MLIDNHVHWHYFPRYEHNSVENLKYDPLGWPNKLEDLSKSIVSDHASLKNIYYENNVNWLKWIAWSKVN